MPSLCTYTVHARGVAPPITDGVRPTSWVFGPAASQCSPLHQLLRHSSAGMHASYRPIPRGFMKLDLWTSSLCLSYSGCPSVSVPQSSGSMSYLHNVRLRIAGLPLQRRLAPLVERVVLH